MNDILKAGQKESTSRFINGKIWNDPSTVIPQ